MTTLGMRLPARNGGLCIDKTTGRAQIMCRDGSKVRFYRAVVEADLGRHLTPAEHVHHKNGDPTDDRIENLEVMTSAEHRKRHAEERTECRRGHPVTPENIYVVPTTGHRQCRVCNRERAARKASAT